MIINDGNQALLNNQAFVHKLRTEGPEKTAAAITDFVRTYIREDSFARKILPPKEVTATDLVQQLDTDQPMRIVEMDQRSEAYAVTYLEGAETRYYKGKKAPVFYNTIESEKFHKPLEEIMTYRTPIKTLIQQNYLKDLQKAEDKKFIEAVDTIIEANPATHKHTSAGPIKFATLVEGIKLMTDKEVPMGSFLICESDFLDLLKQDSNTIGSHVVEDVIVNGFSYTKLLGHTFIRTLKQDIIKPGQIYVFSTPEFLGVFDVLNDVKAFVEQRANILNFHLWETVGMSICNKNGVGKIVLT